VVYLVVRYGGFDLLGFLLGLSSLFLGILSRRCRGRSSQTRDRFAIDGVGTMRKAILGLLAVAALPATALAAGGHGFSWFMMLPEGSTSSTFTGPSSSPCSCS